MATKRHETWSRLVERSGHVEQRFESLPLDPYLDCEARRAQSEGPPEKPGQREAIGLPSQNHQSQRQGATAFRADRRAQTGKAVTASGAFRLVRAKELREG